MSSQSPRPNALTLHATDAAPRAIGPYSQSVEVNGMLYTSGQIALDPASGEMVNGGLEPEARRVFANLAAVLASAGCGFTDVVKTTVFLSDMGDFAALNKVYAEAFGDHKPARSTVQAAALPRGAKVEIDLVARIPG
jgi:2-iminobutanoate/2-iminopropanoate deaminase